MMAGENNEMTSQTLLIVRYEIHVVGEVDFGHVLIVAASKRDTSDILHQLALEVD